MSEKDTQNLFRQESLERLSSPERLDELMKLVNLRTWLPLGTLAALLGLGLIWSFVGRIPVTTSGQGLLVRNGDSSNELVALLHFDNRYRGQFRPGMPVVLMPETLLLYNEPGVMAEITAIAEPPGLTITQARQIADDPNPDSQAGRLEVLAQLAPMVKAMPPDTIVPGVVVEGRITVEQKAPIAFVFPFLDR
ncbi:MAG: hypothetical protein HC886_16720 [Leptolyngbyaceae cyanobacterium SM1_1_3]|nr:hypothetical protein [Leptolyngbyaceae cyanobacterium SM1_1_3]NJN02642.1 hypothetical protein [Leptolyngbyaceae cyanobacterium RM1_1_2]NJO11258.1 hypothetical protein [Leptolyngbyaceae cyanobacterium SL_1_1]